MRMPLHATVPLSLSGSTVPVFLLDGTCFLLRATPSTTAGAAVLAVCTRLGVAAAAHHALFERVTDEHFREVPDATTLARVLREWDAAPLAGAFARVARGRTRARVR